MNRPGARMCKACKEAYKSVEFSRPLDIPRARSRMSKTEQMVACPKCGTLWQAAPPAGRPALRS
jgi:hypothetical protein